MVQLGVRVEKAWEEEIDQIAAEMAAPYKGLTLSRSDALKAIIRRGLDSFAADRKGAADKAGKRKS